MSSGLPASILHAVHYHLCISDPLESYAVPPSINAEKHQSVNKTEDKSISSKDWHERVAKNNLYINNNFLYLKESAILTFL